MPDAPRKHEGWLFHGFDVNHRHAARPDERPAHRDLVAHLVEQNALSRLVILQAGATYRLPFASKTPIGLLMNVAVVSTIMGVPH